MFGWQVDHLADRQMAHAFKHGPVDGDSKTGPLYSWIADYKQLMM